MHGCESVDRLDDGEELIHDLVVRPTGSCGSYQSRKPPLMTGLNSHECHLALAQIVHKVNYDRPLSLILNGLRESLRMGSTLFAVNISLTKSQDTF